MAIATLAPTNSQTSALQTRLRIWSVSMVVSFLIGWGLWLGASTVPNLDTSGTPLGGDFLMFYSAGRMVQNDPLALYDESRQQAEFLQVIPGLEPGSCRLPYRYPPLVAILMAPLSHLSYSTAFAFFTALSIALGCLVVKMLDAVEIQLFGESSHCCGWWLLGWPIAIETILGGQQSLMGLAIAVAVILLVQKNYTVWAGVILGLACYKPNLLMFFALAMIVRYPRMIGGLACTAMATLVLQLLAVGPACIENYVVLASQLATESWGLETPSVKVHGLAPILALWWPGYERKILLTIGILGCVAWSWCDRRIQGDKLAQAASWSCIVIWNALCNPYLPVYDLLLLAIPTLLLLRVGHEHRLSTRCLVVLLGAITLGPHLSQAIAARTGTQLFPAFLASMGIAVACFLGNRSLGRQGLSGSPCTGSTVLATNSERA